MGMPIQLISSHCTSIPVSILLRVQMEWNDVRCDGGVMTIYPILSFPYPISHIYIAYDYCRDRVYSVCMYRLCVWTSSGDLSR